MFAVAIADDHLLFAKSLKLLIDSLPGFQVVFQVSNGQELIDRLSNRSKLPDIILLDINMPKINGVELLLLMQTEGITVPTIVMAGFEGFEEDEMKQFSNVVRFLPKPFEMNDLLESIKEHALR